MATLHDCSSDDPVAVTGKVESGLIRLPLELRQHIYAIIFGSPRLVDLRHVKVALDQYNRDMIYRPKSEKLREKSEMWFERDNSENEKDFESEFGVHASYRFSEDFESGFEENAYRFSVDFMYEWKTGILEVSKAISNEALDVLYGQNAFVVDVHGRGYYDLLKFGVANLRRVRYLRIVARPMGVSYGTPLMFDPKLWLPLLEGLLQFCIVAQQPLAARGYYGAPTLKEDLYEWTTWLDPILEYLSTNLPKTTIVGLDDDGHAETTAMMDKHFKPGYQKVKTITGDFCFERGRYSRESGYWDSDGRDGCNAADGGWDDDWSD